MKKSLFTAFTACCCMMAFSQPVQTLRQRISSFMEANSSMNLEKVLDYTYPKLFELAPRDQMIEVLKSNFDNEQMSIKLDSLKADSIYPVFSMQAGSYAKILYSMKMIMQLKSKEVNAELRKISSEAVLTAMQSQPGTSRSLIDSAGNIIVYMDAVMVAVKDKFSKEWTFINLKEGDPATTQLFTKEILDKLATYK